MMLCNMYKETTVIKQNNLVKKPETASRSSRIESDGGQGSVSKGRFIVLIQD